MLIIIKTDYKKFFKKIFGLNTFIILLWLILPFSIKGEKILKIYFFTITKEGLIETIKISLKYNSIIIITILLLQELNIMHLIHSIRHFYIIPDKISVLIYFYYRYLAETENELKRLLNAVKIRGFIPSTNLHTYKTYANLITHLFIRSYERSQNVYNAMLCRGFNGKIWIWEHFALHKKDLFFLVVNIFIICIIFII